MTESALQLPVNIEPPDEDIARLCRQICLCRARSQSAEAARLEKILRNRLPSEFNPETLQQIFQTEQRRVIDALMLVELLGPMLIERFASVASDKPAAHAAAASPSRTAARRASSLDIADLIDGMLAQEQAARGHAA
ncbi:MAG TPA: hypothetical protein VMI53_10360 [Opitutaceae bacterium]|nr:hypothetical protein [Opitutaceae bacterium]